MEALRLRKTRNQVFNRLNQKKIKIVKKQSKVTKKLKSMNIKRLLILILVNLVLSPIFDFNLYVNKPAQYQLRHKMIFTIPFAFDNFLNQELVLQRLKSSFDNKDQKLVFYNLRNYVSYRSVSYPSLRKNEKLYTSGEWEYGNRFLYYEITISMREQIRIQALLDFISMVIISFILVHSITSMNRQFSQLILNPLERMIQKIQQVTINPLKALQDRTKKSNDEEIQMNETLMIEESINKISKLLILGFGQAGCQVITQFLFNKNCDYDSISSGQKMFAIFGFCDIRNFTDATEVLCEDIMVFVNEIALVVHSSVDKFAGAANKNIGDAFLVVWKLYISENETKTEDGQLVFDFNKIQKNSINSQLAEMALLSFIDIVIRINTDHIITKYKHDDDLNERMPNYAVKLGFGLHVGWAIEGAIGSSYKIDASYLSPNVNMSSRLEGATKIYKKEILFTGELYDMFQTRELRDYCRQIDYVELKGSELPYKLYTIDLNVPNLIHKFQQNSIQEIPNLEIDQDLKFQISQNLGYKKQMSCQTGVIKRRNDFRINKLRTFEEECFVVNQLRNPNFELILESLSLNRKKFLISYNFGFNSYLNGHWSQAKRFLEQAMSLKEDRPSQKLMEVMQSFGFQNPDDWNGVRKESRI